MAECPHNSMGVLRRRYADPLKYASRGSTLNADDCSDMSEKIIQKFTAKRRMEIDDHLWSQRHTRRRTLI